MKRLYCIYDRVASCILGSIIQEGSDAPAIRSFHDALRSPQSAISAHPADYDLLYLGDILTSGIILAVSPPVTVATGAGYLASQTPKLLSEGTNDA